jgi:hypothetical protein
VKVIHLFTGSDGRSHFEDRDVAVTLSEFGATTAPLSALSVSLRDTEGGPTVVGFRPAPRRQLVILLQGKVEYSCGDGSRRVMCPGDVLLATDTDGEGHAATVLENPRLQVFVPLSSDANLDEWFATSPKFSEEHK